MKGFDIGKRLCKLWILKKERERRQAKRERDSVKEREGEREKEFHRQFEFRQRSSRLYN